MITPHAGYRDNFLAMEDSLPGARLPWVKTLRTQAIEAFMDTGLPTTRNEAWKYTDLRSLARKHFSHPAASSRIDKALLSHWTWGDAPAHRLVFVDGRYIPDFYPFRQMLNGVTLTSLATALAEHPEELEAGLGRHTNLEAPGFNAFNTAFMRDGAYIRLGQGAVVEHPIHLLFVSTGQRDAMATVRNLIVAEAGSAATVIESWVTLADADYLTSTITEILIEDNARLEHYKLEQDGDAASHMGGLYVQQGRDSRFTSHNTALGGRLVRNDLHVNLDDSGAECTLNGLTVTRERQHVDNHTRVDHKRPHTTSNAFYKGILDGRSRSVFSGYIIVHQDAQKTSARQYNHNLLLSRDAEADARPQLEIYADDVQCAHGCTVGALDEDALFYLRSRALDEATARGLLVYAFAADVLERIQIRPIRQLLESQLSDRLAGSGALQWYRDEVFH